METDAPDQKLPEEYVRFPLTLEADGESINHPANIAEVYERASSILGIPHTALAGQVQENFFRLFGQ